METVQTPVEFTHSAEKSSLALFHPGLLPPIYFGIVKEYAVFLKTEFSSIERLRYTKQVKRNFGEHLCSSLVGVQLFIYALHKNEMLNRVQ